MKYPLLDGQVVIIYKDLEITRKFYVYSMKLKKTGIVRVSVIGIKLGAKPRHKTLEYEYLTASC